MPFVPSLSMLLGGAAISLAIGAYGGYKLTADHYIAANAKADKEAQQRYNQKVAENSKLSGELEKLRNERSTALQDILDKFDEIDDRPVYQLTCVDDDGVRLINEAAAGRFDTGKSASTVPAAAETR